MIYTQKARIPTRLMAILPTGNAHRNFRARGCGFQKGLTFVEVMVTAVILSAGLVAVYRSFFIGADVMRHLSNRLYALNLIETRIALIERDYRASKDFDVGPLTEEAVINNFPVHFQFVINLKPVDQLLTVFQLDITLSWEERGRMMSLSRSAYFSGITSVGQEGAS